MTSIRGVRHAKRPSRVRGGDEPGVLSGRYQSLV